MDEETILNLCRSGAEAGYEALFERYRLKAWRLAFAICGDAALADDAAQEGFIQAFRSIHNLRAGAPFAPWFYAVVGNAARRQAKRRAWRRWLPITAAEGLADSRPAGTMAGTEERLVIWEAVRELPVDLRMVIALRFVLDLSEADTADVLGVPPGTAKSRMHRAKQALQEKLGELRGEGGEAPCPSPTR